MNLNKIVLGTVQFGLSYGINNTGGKPTQDQVNKILLEAFRSGIRCLDTAEVYGNAHKIIGDFHEKYPMYEFDIITKLPHDLTGRLDSRISKYLNELKVQALAGLLFHSYDSYKKNKHEFEVISKLKKEGVLKNLGVSVYTNDQAMDVLDDDLIDVIQLPFNLLDNFSQREKVLINAKKRGKTVHTRSAFLQGVFFCSVGEEKNIIKLLKEELKGIHEISARNNISIQKLALNYCLQQPLIDRVLIGVDNLTQLKQNINDSAYVLPDIILSEINKIKTKNVDLLNPSLWK